MMRLQQRIASDIAVAAGRPAPPPPGALPQRRRSIQQAYDAYLKGVSAQGQQQFEGFRRAVEYFEQAIGSSRTSPKRTPRWRSPKCNSCLAVRCLRTKRCRRRKQPRAGRCSSMKRSPGRIWRWVRSCSSITGDMRRRRGAGPRGPAAGPAREEVDRPDERLAQAARTIRRGHRRG